MLTARRAAVFLCAVAAIVAGAWLASSVDRGGDRSRLPREPTRNSEAASSSGPRVRGRVVDPLGVPLAGCTVCCESADRVARLDPAAATTGMHVESGADGHFSITLSESGPRHVTLDHPDFEPRTVTVTRDADLGDLELRSGRGALIVVRDLASGAPLPGATASARPALVPSAVPPALARAWCRTAVTDDRGIAMLTGLPPVPHHLTVTAGDRAPVERQLVPGADELTTVELGPALVLRGRVVDGAGAPVEGAVVAALSVARPGVATSARSDHRGGFRLTRLAAGQAVVQAHARGIGESLPITVALPAERTVVLTLASPRPGIPGPEPGRTGSSTSSEAAGAPARDMHPYADRPAMTEFEAEILRGRAWTLDDFRRRDTIDGPVYPSLRGTVRFADGAPAAGAIVSMDGGVRTARADLHGRFAFGSVDRGSHTLSASAIGAEPSSPTTVRVDVPVDPHSLHELIIR